MFSYWWKWSGRYSHAFALVFWGDACNYRITYSVVILLSFFTLWLSVFGIASELGEKGARGQAVFIATFWLFAVLCSYGTVQQWYLLVELESLIAGYVFTLVYIWSLCRLWNRAEASSGIQWFPISSCIIAAGFYEHSAPLVLAVSIAAWLLAVLYDHANRKVFFLLAKVSLVCFLLVYLARGNFRRQTKRGMTLAMMLEQLLNAGRDWWTYVIPACINPVYIAALFVAVWVKPRSKIPLTEKIPAPFILLGCFVLFCGFSLGLVIVHALSDVTVGEAAKIPANIAQYSVVFVFFGLFACREWLHLHALRVLGRPVWLLAVLAVLLGGNSNFFPVLWNGLSGEISRYAAAYEKRTRVVAEHEGGEITVMPLMHAPMPITSDSLAAGGRDWPNKYAGSFYGLKSLACREVSAAEAYTEAQKRGTLVWRDANDGTRVAYVPSLATGSNETYVFDWIFLESADGAPPRLRVLVLAPESFFVRLLASGEVPDRLKNGAWPFANIFNRPAPRPFAGAGQRLYAVPLPQSDTDATGTGNNTFLSVNGGPLFSAMRGNTPVSQ